MELFDALSTLSATQVALLVGALVIAFGFECVNGFHDTANAVATVIYTKSLKPTPAVIWSGIWNFIGVHVGGIGVAFSESRLDENLLYVGSDDGLLHVTEDGGATWRKMDGFPGVPTLAFVSSVVASRHDPDRVYATFNHWKRGDFTPYILRSDDRGESWVSVAGNLPDRHVVWDLVEDPENENLLFLGTEFALFFSLEGGGNWIELTGNTPTVAFRDIEIHEGMGDLVAASFGRGWWVLDDYTALRSITPGLLAQDGALFDVRPAYVYNPLGYNRISSGEYAAENPPFGAIVDYYLREPVSGAGASVFLAILNSDGTMLAEVLVANEPGVQRGVWNLRGQPPQTEAQEDQGRRPRMGPLVEPGSYTVSLFGRRGDQAWQIAGPKTIRVVPLPESGR